MLLCIYPNTIHKHCLRNCQIIGQYFVPKNQLSLNSYPSNSIKLSIFIIRIKLREMIQHCKQQIYLFLNF